MKRFEVTFLIKKPTCKISIRVTAKTMNEAVAAACLVLYKVVQTDVIDFDVSKVEQV